MKIIYILTLLPLLFSCHLKKEQKKQLPKKLSGEYIYRLHNEYFFSLKKPKKVVKDPYPWEKNYGLPIPKITLDHFRCKGNAFHPPRLIKQKGKPVFHCYDCKGPNSHTLPIKNHKEFIYPVLIDLLNHLQEKTGKKVIITSGHRCPEHNTYVDPSEENKCSKHQIGASVSFYIQGLESFPEVTLDLIKNFFEKKFYQIPFDQAKEAYTNDEVIVYLFSEQQGRNYDNRHPYPYFTVEVLYDKQTNTKVIFSLKDSHALIRDLDDP